MYFLNMIPCMCASYLHNIRAIPQLHFEYLSFEQNVDDFLSDSGFQFFCCSMEDAVQFFLDNTPEEITS